MPTENIVSDESKPCIELETDGDLVIRPSFWKKYRKYLIPALIAIGGGLGGSSILSQYLTLPSETAKAQQANASEHAAFKDRLDKAHEKLSDVDTKIGDRLKSVDDRFGKVEDKLEGVRRLQCWLAIRGAKNVPPEITRMCL